MSRPRYRCATPQNAGLTPFMVPVVRLNTPDFPASGRRDAKPENRVGDSHAFAGCETQAKKCRGWRISPIPDKRWRMATEKTAHGQALGNFEPSLTMTFLPKCPGCGAPHPRARGLDLDSCYDCGTFCPTGAPRTIPAIITGFTPWALAARFLLWAGRRLNDLARSI